MNPFGAVLWLCLLVFTLTGWVLNIVHLVQSLGGPVTALFIARIVGIPVFVLGSVLGLFV